MKLQCSKKTIVVIALFLLIMGIFGRSFNPIITSFLDGNTNSPSPSPSSPNSLIKNNNNNKNTAPEDDDKTSITVVETEKQTQKSSGEEAINSQNEAVTAPPSLNVRNTQQSLPSSTGGVSWKELGNAGWKKPNREFRESLLTCPKAKEKIENIYAEAATINNKFASSPRFGMPWFFHDPAPVCGSILLRHFHGSLDTVPILRFLKKSSSSSLLSSQGKTQKEITNPPRDFQEVFGNLDPQTEVIDDEENLIAGREYRNKIFIEECGDGRDFSQVLFTARLISHNFIIAAKVTKKLVGDHIHDDQGDAKNSFQYEISFIPPAVGDYILEVKTVHANGTSDNPTVPRSLGVVGIRASIGGKKAFMYNAKCDHQRHILGSPLLVRVKKSFEITAVSSSKNAKAQNSAVAVVSSEKIPLCTRGDHDSGFWVRMANPALCHLNSNPFCAGDPVWVSDASAYNHQYVWVPTNNNNNNNVSSTPNHNEERHQQEISCKYHYWTPPQGPMKSCLRHGEARGFLYIVGDSVMREYAKNCELISLRGAHLQCLFANIALEGQHFSNSYAESVAKTIVTNTRENNAGIFVTNLGLQHMIGPCTTKQWKIFVRYFVLHWKQQIVWQKGTAQQKIQLMKDENNNNNNNNNNKINQDADVSEIQISPRPLPDTASPEEIEAEKLKKFYFAPRYLKTKGEYPKLEQAVWIGPPTIQYARKGMGAERAALWDEIAWKELEPLGFKRMKSIPVTAARQEGTWDGLHYASARGKVQTALKNRDAKIYRWNGGIANVLFTILLNMICNV